MSAAAPISKPLYLFSWQGVDAFGHLQQGNILAKETATVHQHLIALSLQPITVKNKLRLRPAYWKNTELIAFIRQLATLLQAGLPLVNSLMLLATDHAKAPWQCILKDIAKGVKEGKPLSAMLASFPDIFPLIYRHIIAIGELNGQLEPCCLQLAAQQEQQANLRSKVKKALRYPIIVCSIASIVTILMLTMVLPEFAKIYASFDAQLPWFTTLLILASQGLLRFGPALTLLIVIAAVFYFKKCHPDVLWRRREQNLLMRMPLVRNLIVDSCLGQIFQTLAM